MPRELGPDELAVEAARQEKLQQANARAMNVLIQIRINLAGGIMAHLAEVDYARALHHKKEADPSPAADVAVKAADALMARLGLARLSAPGPHENPAEP